MNVVEPTSSDMTFLEKLTGIQSATGSHAESADSSPSLHDQSTACSAWSSGGLAGQLSGVPTCKGGRKLLE
jgi:hypothetical protein